MQRHRFGRRAESLPEDQLLMALEEAEQVEAEGLAGDEAADPVRREARAARRRANRGALPSHLPRSNGTVRNFVCGRAVEQRLRPCGLEAVGEENGELALGHGPFPGRHLPLLLRAVQDQEQVLHRGFIGREVSPGPHCASEL